MTYNEQQALVTELDEVEADLEQRGIADLHARVREVRFRLQKEWAVPVPSRGRGRSLWEEEEENGA